jgi:hypothetical protein
MGLQQADTSKVRLNLQSERKRTVCVEFEVLLGVRGYGDNIADWRQLGASVKLVQKTVGHVVVASIQELNLVHSKSFRCLGPQMIGVDAADARQGPNSAGATRTIR